MNWGLRFESEDKKVWQTDVCLIESVDNTWDINCKCDGFDVSKSMKLGYELEMTKTRSRIAIDTIRPIVSTSLVDRDSAYTEWYL